MNRLILMLSVSFIAACASNSMPDSAPPSEMSQPMPVASVPPLYPREALLKGTPGWVRFGFNINDDGTVTDIRVLESEPGRMFVASARRAFARWRFDPRDAGPATYTIKFEVAPADD